MFNLVSLQTPHNTNHRTVLMGSFRRGVRIARENIVLRAVALSTFALWLHGGGASATRPQETIQHTVINVGQEITSNLTSGQKHAYRVTAPIGHFSRLIIQPGDFALRFAIYDPNG